MRAKALTKGQEGQMDEQNEEWEEGKEKSSSPPHYIHLYQQITNNMVSYPQLS